MSTELEYVPYSEFVAGLSTTENPTSADKTVISNPTNGPRAVPGSAKDRATTLTAFREGDAIPVDGTTLAKMPYADLLRVTAENALAGNVAPAFDPTRTSVNPYKAGESVAYNGKIYTFKVDHYGAWDASHVDATNMQDYISVLFDADFERENVELNDLVNIDLEFSAGGYIRYTDGVMASAVEGYHTDFIPVKPGQHLKISCYISNPGASVACFTKEKIYIQSASVLGNYNSDFIVPENVYYVVASSYGDLTTRLCSVVGALPGSCNFVKNVLDLFACENEIYTKNYTLENTGYINYSAGTPAATTSDNAKFTDYIFVKPGQKYRIQTSISSEGAGIACYDINKTYSQSSSVAGDYNGVFTIPSGIYYIVVSLYRLTNPFICRTVSVQGEMDEIKEDIEENAAVIGSLYSNKNYSFTNNGYINYEYGYVASTTSTTYMHTDYILVSEGVEFDTTLNIGNVAASIACFDENKTYIKAKSIAGSSAEVKKIFVVPSGVSYVVFSSNVVDTTAVASRFPFMINDGKSNLNAKATKVLIFGDSITDCANITITNGETSAYSWKNPNNSYINGGGVTVKYMMWPYMLNVILNAVEVRNYAKSGATYKDRVGATERQNLSEQVSLAVADLDNPNGVFAIDHFVPDIIIFALGVNDGAWTDNPQTTLNKIVWNLDHTEIDIDATLSALDLSISADAALHAYLTMRKHFPSAFGLVVSPIQTMSRDILSEQTYSILETLSSYCGFVCINGAKLSGITRFGNVNGGLGATLKDGLHPNEVGQNMMARMIISAINDHYYAYKEMNP